VHALPDFDALLPRVLEQHGVELAAEHLPGLRALVLDRLKEVERLRDLARDRDELDAVFLRARGLAEPVDDAQAVQREPGVRDERLADVIARKRGLAVHEQHTMPVLGEQSAHGRAAGPAANDNRVVRRR
jgi:hypothetical protein